jgi:tripartite-type tricarboxylate transporter receptor subunit TctC
VASPGGHTTFYAGIVDDRGSGGVSVRGGLVVLVEPFGKGGGVDVIARLVADPFAAALGARVVVDNRPGLGATAAPAFVASALADGRTLLLNTSAHAYSAALAEHLPYDPIADFVPVAAVTSQAYVLVTSPNTGLRSLADLARAGRSRPGGLSFVSMGVGTGSHVCAAQLNRDLGIDARHFPARAEDGISETIARVAVGEADYMVSPISIAAPLFAGGALVALGVTAARRSPLLPRAPTLAEAGAEGFDFPIWYGLWAPVATPAPVVEELSAAVTRSLQSPELASRLKEHGAEILRLTRTEFEELVRSEAARARRLA